MSCQTLDRVICNKDYMDKVALIDGDSFLYRAGFAVEKTKYLVSWNETCQEVANAATAKDVAGVDGGTIWTRKELGTLDNAIAIMDAMVRNALSAVGYRNYYLYLSPTSGNFRDAIGTLRKYKGNRDGNTRPVYYPDLREHMVLAHQAIIARGEEADDQISWVARKLLRDGKETVIIGIDKDLLQIPGKHYNWVDNEHIDLSEDESRLFYWSQVLAGDAGDNVGGCHGLGLKKAEHFLTQCNGFSDDAMWPKIVRKFRDSQRLEHCPYKDRDAEDVALETARLVRLRQEMDEPLWTPKMTKDGKNAKSVEAEEAT